jgi:hypothetical protein
LTLDLSYGNWQLTLSRESQECQSFITPEGVYSPTRVPHGTTNAVAHLQSVLQGAFCQMAEQLILWLDDRLLHASSLAKLFEHLRSFFTICRERNLKLHPGKCVLFATEVRIDIRKRK